MHATAGAPSRATTSTTISFGLINIPVSLYTATEETRVARKEFTEDGHAVGRQSYDKETGAVVDTAAVVRKAEATSGALVILTDQEIADATGHKSGVAPIIGRIPMKELDREFVCETIYQIRPKRDKQAQAANDAAFALLTQALAATDEAALIRVSIRGSVAKWGAITPDGVLRVVHSVDQIRKALPMPTAILSDQHVALAKTLLESIPAAKVEDIVDDSSKRIQEFVDAKAATLVAGGELVEPAPLAPPVIVDLIGQLTASLAKAS